MSYIYSSSHSGAPTLATTAGGILNILDACLVGTTGIAYGTTPSMGWTLEYSATNQRSYRMPTAGSSGHYLSVTDTNTGAYAAVNYRGYKTMTSVSGGTDPFPTVAQMANGVICDKGNTASTNKSWHLWSNGYIFHLIIDALYSLTTGEALASAKLFTFGDIESTYPSDTNNCLIMGYSSTGGTVAYPLATTVGAASEASYLAGNYNGTTLSIQIAKSPIQSLYKYVAYQGRNYNGSFNFSKLLVLDIVGSVRTFRGYIPGLYANNSGLSQINFNRPIFSTSGKSFNCFTVYNNNPLGVENADGGV